jgi:chemotaxis protein methyltransferase CheR
MQDTRGREDIEIKLLLDGMFRGYGCDFRDYAPASLRRRLHHAMREEKVDTVTGLLEKVLHHPGTLERLLVTLTVNVTAMFRDPGFYLTFRKRIVPILRTYPYLRIWHVGCSTGEEVYSMAIVLEEEGLFCRTKFYATDTNHMVLGKAMEGIFPLRLMQDYTKNYLAAGGRRSFSEYYTARYEHALFKPSLKTNIVWAQHNLVTDSSFNEFHVILCRNVMIYFNRTLQERVHHLLYESLIMLGYLGLGSRESLESTPYETCYEPVESHEKLYRKVK